MSNQAQRDFINNAARPHMETLIRILHELDTYFEDIRVRNSTWR